MGDIKAYERERNCLTSIACFLTLSPMSLSVIPSMRDDFALFPLVL